MRLLILNGIPENSEFLDYEQEIEKLVLENKIHNIDYFRLREMDIKYCNGCWSCWTRTPGRCAIKDEYEQIFSRMSNVDMILYVSPVILGYESSLIKKCKDRSIGNLHPYIVMYKGEQHHRKRYSELPEISVMLIKDKNTTKEDIDLIASTYQRNALNVRKESVAHFAAINEIGGVEDVFNSL